MQYFSSTTAATMPVLGEARWPMVFQPPASCSRSRETRWETREYEAVWPPATRSLSGLARAVMMW